MSKENQQLKREHHAFIRSATSARISAEPETADNAEIAVRDALPSDLDKIVELLSAHARHHQTALAGLNFSKRLESILFDCGTAVETIVAIRDDQICGFAVFSWGISTFNARPKIFLEDIFVDAAHRQKGVAEHLLNHVRDRALHKDACKIELHVQNRNALSYAFFNTQGAEQHGDWSPYSIAL